MKPHSVLNLPKQTQCRQAEARDMLGPGQGSCWEKLSGQRGMNGWRLGRGTSHSHGGAWNLEQKEGPRSKTARIPCPSTSLPHNVTLFVTVKDGSGHIPAESPGMVPRMLGGFQVEAARIYRKGECAPSSPWTVRKSAQPSRTQGPGV